MFVYGMVCVYAQGPTPAGVYAWVCGGECLYAVFCMRMGGWRVLCVLGGGFCGGFCGGGGDRQFPPNALLMMVTHCGGSRRALGGQVPPRPRPPSQCPPPAGSLTTIPTTLNPAPPSHTVHHQQGL